MSSAKERVAAMEEKARKIIEKADALRKRRQEKCKHPLESLDFRNGATTSYGLDRSVTHSMVVTCALCDASFHRQLVIHNDIY